MQNDFDAFRFHAQGLLKMPTNDNNGQTYAGLIRLRLTDLALRWVSSGR